MPKLWLTYAWKDNEENQVDYVGQRLRDLGIDVQIDRTQLQAGRDLLEQVDEHIANADLDAWAIYVTPNSLASGPCREELSYALHRAVSTRGREFPLIGIFPTAVIAEHVPTAISTRWCVTLNDKDWATRIWESLTGKNPIAAPYVQPYVFKEHATSQETIFEMRPREGIWYPAKVLVPEAERPLLKRVFSGPVGSPTYKPAYTEISEPSYPGPGGTWSGIAVHNRVDSMVSLYAAFKSRPSAIAFGGEESVLMPLS